MYVGPTQPASISTSRRALQVSYSESHDAGAEHWIHKSPSSDVQRTRELRTHCARLDLKLACGERSGGQYPTCLNAQCPASQGHASQRRRAPIQHTQGCEASRCPMRSLPFSCHEVPLATRTPVPMSSHEAASFGGGLGSGSLRGTDACATLSPSWGGAACGARMRLGEL